MNKKHLLVLIIILSFFLRFYKLDVYPALNADEASNTYDAYSLLETGRDQHGNSWPVNFQSFNDYKPGFYVYMMLPFVKVLGLNVWSARIPGSLLGVGSVFLIYFFVKKLFKNEKLALTAAGFLAVSPWHIHYSRGGWEVNVATFFILFGLTMLFYAREAITDKKIRYLILSAIGFSSALYSYHAARVIVPVLAVGYVIIYNREILKDFKNYLIFVVLGAILVTPLALDMFRPQAFSRAAGVGLFADKGPVSRINEQRGEHSDLKSLSSKLLHNKAVNYGLAFLNNYSTHFNGEFLFMSGDSIQRNKVPETGQMFLIDILFLIFACLVFFRDFDKNKKFLIFWLAIAPLASALTFQSPNALRSQNMVIPLIILSAYGAVYAYEFFDKNKLTSLSLLLTVIFIWNFARYQDMFWNYMSKSYPYSSQYGVEELYNYLKGEDQKYKNIFITGRYDQPYILYLFYSKYPPENFQGRHSLTSRDEYGFSSVADVGKFHFGPIDLESIKSNYPDSLIIGAPEEIPQTENIIKRIYGSNGFEYFNVVQN